ncbi:hypothetical protein FNH22_04730 [Fulvivirga sp. M361]|uniref:hypothetical protein n=1 Tax=Fulvivirga sp. M361 TaxID=2594266 RepID=UPI00117AAE72|nr:hypothetical protein [Fulvivirga sp. M361]TRX61365.1 hypothetical protein FNH22_04730 [Fulvivirga sp. M361]
MRIVILLYAIVIIGCSPKQKEKQTLVNANLLDAVFPESAEQVAIRLTKHFDKKSLYRKSNQTGIGELDEIGFINPLTPNINWTLFPTLHNDSLYAISIYYNGDNYLRDAQLIFSSYLNKFGHPEIDTLQRPADFLVKAKWTNNVLIEFTYRAEVVLFVNYIDTRILYKVNPDETMYNEYGDSWDFSLWDNFSNKPFQMRYLNW